MARRIGLAVALVGDPDLLVLDEPTSGLDPIGTREVKDLIKALSARGKTVLLSSHLLADVEDACHRIAILYGGQLRALGTTADLLARDERLQIELDRPKDEEKLRALEAAARDAGGGSVSIGPPSDRLEAFFLRVIGKARSEGLETGGARSGGAVAAFLGGVAKPVSMAPIPTSAPLLPSAPVLPSPPLPREAAGGGDAPRVERLAQPADEPKPAGDSTKTKAVLDRLLGGGSS